MKKVFALFGTIALDGMSTVHKQLTGLNKTLKDASKALAKTGRDLDKLGMSLTKTFTAPIVAAGTAITLIAKQTGEYADRILDLQQITGLSTGALQKWKYAIEQSGGSFDDFAKSIPQFTNRLPEIIKGGNESSKAFSKLGVALKDASGNVRSMDDLFPEMIRALQNVENVAERNALAQDIFGRSLEELAPVIGMTQVELDKLFKSAEETGAVMSEDALKAADELRGMMVALQSAITVLGRNLAVSFVPVFRDTIVPLIERKVVPVIRDFADNIISLIDWFKNLPPGVRDTAVKFTALLAVTGPLVMGLGKMMKAVAGLRATVLLLNSALFANPFTIVAIAVGLLTFKIVDNINKVRELKKEFSMMTVEQAAINNFVFLFTALENKMKAGVAAGKSESEIYKELTGDINTLTEKARELKFEIEGTTKERYDALSVINLEVQGVRDATGALVKYSAEKRNAKKATKELSEEELEAAKKAAEAATKAAEAKAKAERDMYLAVRNEQKDSRKSQEDDESEELKNKKQMVDAVRAQQKEAREGVDKTDKANAEAAEKEKDRQKELQQLKIGAAFSALNVLSSFNQNAEIAADNRYKKDRERIENSVMSEEEKKAALEKLDTEYEKKKNAIRRRQAVIDKAQAVFEIGLSTSVAIVKAYPNLVLAAIIGGLAALQAAAVLASPIPAAEEGAYLPGTDEGTVIRAGEKNKPEIILPLDTGIDAFISRLSERSRGLFAQGASGSPALAAAAAGGTGNIVQHHYHILQNGIIIGNRSGLKELERTLSEFRFAEETRKGA